MYFLEKMQQKLTNVSTFALFSNVAYSLNTVNLLSSKRSKILWRPAAVNLKRFLKVCNNLFIIKGKGLLFTNAFQNIRAGSNDSLCIDV